MAKYLLDSNICGFLFRHKYGVPERIAEVGLKECAISQLTAIELAVGVEYTLQKTGINQYGRLKKFLDAITVFPIEMAADLAAQEKARLQLCGTPSEDLVDTLIACTAIKQGLIMVTENTRHFVNFKNIQLENWVDRTK